jgi:hypothetical protein
MHVVQVLSTKTISVLSDFTYYTLSFSDVCTPRRQVFTLLFVKKKKTALELGPTY